MKKNYIFSFLVLTALSACADPVPNYAHNTNAACPPSQQVPEAVAAQLSQAPQNSLMAQFYKHYLEQQRELAAFSGNMPGVTTDRCPAAFWVTDSVAAEFRAYPEGSAMREFFKNYVAQQKAIDAYYSPTQIQTQP